MLGARLAGCVPQASDRTLLVCNQRTKTECVFHHFRETKESARKMCERATVKDDDIQRNKTMQFLMQELTHVKHIPVPRRGTEAPPAPYFAD